METNKKIAEGTDDVRGLVASDILTSENSDIFDAKLKGLEASGHIATSRIGNFIIIGAGNQKGQLLPHHKKLAEKIEKGELAASISDVDQKFIEFKRFPDPEIMAEIDNIKYMFLTKKEREADIVPVRNSKTNPKINRNSLCTCGSGRKYKRCCGA
jgi:hypothetical protein